MSDEFEELREEFKCHCDPAWTDRGLHHPNECRAYLLPLVEGLERRLRETEAAFDEAQRNFGATLDEVAELERRDECGVDGIQPCHRDNTAQDYEWCHACLLSRYRRAVAGSPELPERELVETPQQAALRIVNALNALDEDQLTAAMKAIERASGAALKMVAP